MLFFTRGLKYINGLRSRRPLSATKTRWPAAQGIQFVFGWQTLFSANIQARLLLTLVSVASDVVSSLQGPKCLFPPGRKTLPNFITPLPHPSDITLPSNIYNRPWKHPGNTDTLGLSIIRRAAPSGWIPSSVDPLPATTSTHILTCHPTAAQHSSTLT